MRGGEKSTRVRDKVLADVAEDEPFINFERALTGTDPANRIHFNLNAQQALPATSIRLTVDLISAGWWDAAASGQEEQMYSREVLAMTNWLS